MDILVTKGRTGPRRFPFGLKLKLGKIVQEIQPKK